MVDPFGGSGVTAVEALVLRRRAVHIDLNPLANFIAECIAVAPVDIDALTKEYERVIGECTPYLSKLSKMENKEVEKLPIKDWYPKDVRLPLNADRRFVHQLYSPRQLRSLSKIRASIMKTNDDIIKNLLMYVFSATITKCNLLFSSTKGRIPSRGNTSPIQVYRYWIPPNPVELDSLNEFNSKFKKFIEAKRETNLEISDYYSSDNIKILRGDAANLKNEIDEESVDYIYTDPPYGANIDYLGLSTMWNAWLGFEVDDEDKQAEVIEGGDLQKTKNEYCGLLRQSIYEIFRILKFDRWFSLVFVHKDPLFWDTIIKAAESCGFEYVNMAVVKAGIVSYHKHKNPLKVLSSEMVINFVKKRRPRALAVTKVGIKTVDFILNSAELSIAARDGGAGTDEIYEDLIPKLIENGLLSELKDKISDFTPLLADKFDFDAKIGKWSIIPNTKLGGFVPIDLRIRFYIESYLNQCRRKGIKATLEMIWANIIPLLKNGDQPSDQKLITELNKIAEPYEGKYYRIRKELQRELFDKEDLYKRPIKYKLPEWLVENEDDIEHNEIIHRLALLCNDVGLRTLVGLNERKSGNYAKKLTDISISKLPRGLGLKPYSRKKVEQIDLIWFDAAGFPAYAFEIEKTSSITSAIERFIELLKISIRVSGKTIIVCPSSRRRKLDEVLTESPYIGSPMFMENKIKYLYFKDVVDIYSSYRKSAQRMEALVVEIRKRLKSPS